MNKIIFSAMRRAWNNFWPLLAILAFITLVGVTLSLIIALLSLSLWPVALLIGLAAIYLIMFIYEVVR